MKADYNKFGSFSDQLCMVTICQCHKATHSKWLKFKFITLACCLLNQVHNSSSMYWQQLFNKEIKPHKTLFF